MYTHTYPIDFNGIDMYTHTYPIDFNGIHMNTHRDSRILRYLLLCPA